MNPSGYHFHFISARRAASPGSNNSPGRLDAAPDMGHEYHLSPRNPQFPRLTRGSARDAGELLSAVRPK